MIAYQFNKGYRCTRNATNLFIKCSRISQRIFTIIEKFYKQRSELEHHMAAQGMITF